MSRGKVTLLTTMTLVIIDKQTFLILRYLMQRVANPLCCMEVVWGFTALPSRWTHTHVTGKSPGGMATLYPRIHICKRDNHDWTLVQREIRAVLRKLLVKVLCQ